MSNAFVAGFFDGEGHVNLKCKRVSMSQKDPKVLYRIQKYLGYGSVLRSNRGSHTLYVYSRANREDFIRRVLPHSVVKRAQLKKLKGM